MSEYDGDVCPVCGQPFDHYDVVYGSDKDTTMRQDVAVCKRDVSTGDYEYWVHV